MRRDAYLRQVGVVAYLSVHGHLVGVDSRRRDDERRGEQERQHRPCGDYQAHERLFTNSLADNVHHANDLPRVSITDGSSTRVNATLTPRSRDVTEPEVLHGRTP